MDWNPRLLHSYPGNVPLPFFMAHPGYLPAEQEKALLQDFEYFQQTYPLEVKRYMQKIAEILDKFDYEGGMIYDEYPDRYSMQRLAGTIVQILKREEQDFPEEKRTSADKWIWLQDMIQVLLCNEICKRRHGSRRGFLKF